MRNYIILLLLIFLSGCAVGPDYERPEIKKPDKFIYLDSLKISDSTAIATVDTTWWSLFGDSELNRLIKKALKENTDINIASARVEEFMGRYGVSKSDFYPKFGADVSAVTGKFSSVNTGTDNNPSRSIFKVNLNANWEIDIWGKIKRAAESAEADLLAAEESRKGVVLLVTTQLANAYIDLLTLKKQLDITNNTVNIRENSLALFRLRLDKGDISNLELSQLESEYWYAKSQVPLIEKNIAVLENAISVLIGNNPERISSDNTLDSISLPTVPPGIPSELLERRPDIRQSENNLISANAKIGAVKALYYPSISLSGVLGFASNDLTTILDPASQVWNIGGGIIAPLFRAGEISSQVKVAEAYKKQVLYKYINTIRNAFKEVEDALVDRNKTENQLYMQRKMVETLTTYLSLAEMKYNEGATSYLEVLDAQRSLFDAQMKYALIQANLFKSVINIYSAIGGGWIDKAANESVQPSKD